MNKICYLLLFAFMSMSTNAAERTFIDKVNYLPVTTLYPGISMLQETDLKNGNLYFYDNNGLLIDSQSTSGVIRSTSAGSDFIIIDVVLFLKSNGGLCVVDGNGIVIQFLSFGNIIIASNGPAVGLSSENKGNQNSFTISL